MIVFESDRLKQAILALNPSLRVVEEQSAGHEHIVQILCAGRGRGRSAVNRFQ